EGAKAFDWRHYRIVWDSRYDELGGEKAGNSRDRFISYEVESEGSYGCGQEVTFQGKGLTICSKSCRSEGEELLFTYRLGYPEWAGQRRLSHKKLSGLSLLGEVISREGERLKLDIDREHSDWKQEKIFAYRGAYAPLLSSYFGGSQGHSPTFEQAHVGSDLLTLVS
ncbi:MAG: hypothetical protein SOY47_00055, partial [Lachnospiraceae bacterium]|nr:hypothetical protein [Lachnospiraceae bacterium]